MTCYLRALAGLLLVVAMASLLAPQSVAAGVRIRAVPATPISGEAFTVSGATTTRFIRRVELRSWTGSRWATIRRARTAKRGAFRFPGVRTSTARRYVVVAPPTRYRDKRYRQQSTSALSVRVARQRADLAMLPPIAQMSADVQSAERASLVGTARFQPARPGRAVFVQRRIGDSWITEQRTRQSSAGTVTFTQPATSAAHTYRAVTAAAKGAQAAATPAGSSQGWERVFTDEFNGTTLDATRWNYRQVGQRHGSRLKSESSTAAVEVANGQVKLRVRENPGERGTYANGHIGTQGTFAFRHGVAAARIKFPRGQGQHGSFWMQPSGTQRSDGPPAVSGAEIDVVEFFGAGRPLGGLAHFLYWNDANGEVVKYGAEVPAATDGLAEGDAWWKNYHVFSVQWTPTGYTFRVDGRETWRTGRGVSQVKQFLVLSLLTSDWELDKLDKTTLPTMMSVDWVRVWQ